MGWRTDVDRRAIPVLQFFGRTAVSTCQKLQDRIWTNSRQSRSCNFWQDCGFHSAKIRRTGIPNSAAVVIGSSRHVTRAPRPHFASTEF